MCGEKIYADGVLIKARNFEKVSFDLTPKVDKFIYLVDTTIDDVSLKTEKNKIAEIILHHLLKETLLPKYVHTLQLQELIMILRLYLLFLAGLPEVISFASHQEKKLIQRREVQLFTIKEDGHGQDSRGNNELSRRNLFNSAMKSALTIGTVLGPAFQAANAGLVQFPCDYDLMNTYHFMRAGESLLESQNLLSTNPLFL